MPMTLTEKILERLQVAAEETAKLFDLMTTVAFDAGYRKMRCALLQPTPRFKTNWAEWYRERQRFYVLLSYLKREGVVASRKMRGSRSSRWQITKKGRARLEASHERAGNPFSRKNITYSKSNRPALVIVAFDIPEREEAKRRWLRECLKRFNYRMLQKSVWIGAALLPEEFLRDLRKHKMLNYVHVFNVSRRGTMRKIGGEKDPRSGQGEDQY